MEARFKAIEIADMFVQHANDIDDSIDNLKLNKMLYFAQGWSLARLGKPLFKDEIQAWDLGPVIPDVYHTFKVCGKSQIPEPKEAFDEDRLSSDELILITDVYSEYGKYTGLTLKQMTHRANTPWDKVYEKGKNNVISQESIKEYFRTKEKPSTFEIDFNKAVIVNAIPADWDSKEDGVYDTV